MSFLRKFTILVIRRKSVIARSLKLHISVERFLFSHFSIVKKTKEFVGKSLICKHERVPFRNSQLLLRAGIISRPILSSPTSDLNQFDPDNEHVPLRGSYISNIQDIPTGKPAGANSQRTGQFNCINTSVNAF